MILPKKYQVFENVESAVHTQVKGVLYTNYSRQHIRGISNRVWDVADYVIPPQVSSYFVTLDVDAGRQSYWAPVHYR